MALIFSENTVWLTDPWQDADVNFSAIPVKFCKHLIQSHQQHPRLHHVGSLTFQDGCLNMRCKLTLPFNGAFAHVVHMPGLSAATGLQTWNEPGQLATLAILCSYYI
jgi:hypothetical protein